MKRKLTLILLAFFPVLAGIKTSQAQVDVSTGGPSTTYTTLKEAFDAINAGLHSGTILIGISGNTTETASAVLNASGTGSASYLSITINPTGGAARTITGSVPGHLIDLNGADNVTIDGLNTGGNSLVISNTSTVTSSTIRFFADATGNTVTNCTVTGSTTNFGVIYFAAGGTVTGNDNNTVSNCNIGPAGTNMPVCCIYSFGTTGFTNSGNSVTGNLIHDYFSAGSSSSGMNINSNSSSWTISGNRFYQTADRIYTTAGQHYGILITSGDGYTITDNIIGFANSSGTGTTNMMGLTSGTLGGTFPSAYTVGGAANKTRFAAINCAFTASGAMSSIQGNTISGFALYTNDNTSSSMGNFCGIAVTSGNVSIGNLAGNAIGTPNSSIYVASTASAGLIAGIYVTTSNTAVIQNNTFQNLDAMGTTASQTGGIYAINTDGAGGVITITGNTIGNATNPNLRMGNLTTGTNLSNAGTTFSTATGTGIFIGIRNNNTGTATIGTLASPNIIQNAAANTSASLGLFRGIQLSGGTNTVTGNTIKNITGASGGTSYSSGGLGGIGILVSGTTNPVISDNLISGLSLTNPGASGYTLGGIVFNTPVSSATVLRNRIWDFSNASNSVTAATPGTATGIFIRDGGAVSWLIANNMVTLGTGQSGNTTFAGIWMQSNTSSATTVKIYYNSISISGTVAAGAQPSMCIQRGELSGSANTVFTVDAKNNLLTNTRSGGTGKHYVLSNSYPSVASSATGWPAGATNYNVLNGNAATIGYWSADQTFTGWKTASACDANSLTAIPVTFLHPSDGDLHLSMGASPTLLESGGTAIATVTTDIDGETRPGPAGSLHGGAFAPDFGADEFDGYPVLPLSVSAITTPATCNGSANGSVTATAAGGQPPYTYAWSNLATTASISGLAAGTYALTVTDALFAVATGSWTVTEPGAISLAGTPTGASCPTAADGSISLAVSGGTSPYGFLWSNGATLQSPAGLLPGSYSVTVTDGGGCTASSAWTVSTLNPVCNNTSVSGTVSGTICYDAQLTITASNLTVTATANVTMIAGQNILILPQTTIPAGASFHAYISTLFCDYVPTVPAAQVTTVETDDHPSLPNAGYILYPNPTSGKFTLQVNGDIPAYARVEIYSIHGDRMVTTQMTGERRQEFETADLPAGVYFVKIVAGDFSKTVKLIRTH